MLSKHLQIFKTIHEYPSLILVLERLNIFPGVQDQTIEEIAEKSKINCDLLILLLEMQLNVDFIPKINLPPKDIPIIVQYLSLSHDYFTEELFPSIAKKIDIMAKSSDTPSINMVNTFFSDYQQEAEKHFDYENQIAFPYILSLLNKHKTDEKDLSAEYSVNIYHEHHDNIEEKLDDLKHLLIKYLPADKNYKLRRNIILELHRLDKDLNAHAKIENNVLIPLVKKLEEKNILT